VEENGKKETAMEKRKFYVFADISERAYAATVYLRAIGILLVYWIIAIIVIDDHSS